jgi:hypothetical protein
MPEHAMRSDLSIPFLATIALVVERQSHRPVPVPSSGTPGGATAPSDRIAAWKSFSVVGPVEADREPADPDTTSPRPGLVPIAPVADRQWAERRREGRQWRTAPPQREAGRTHSPRRFTLTPKAVIAIDGEREDDGGAGALPGLAGIDPALALPDGDDVGIRSDAVGTSAPTGGQGRPAVHDRRRHRRAEPSTPPSGGPRLA